MLISESQTNYLCCVCATIMYGVQIADLVAAMPLLLVCLGLKLLQFFSPPVFPMQSLLTKKTGVTNGKRQLWYSIIYGLFNNSTLFKLQHCITGWAVIIRSSHGLTCTGFGRVTNTIKNLSQDSWVRNRDLSSGRSEYEAESYPLNCGIQLS